MPANVARKVQLGQETTWGTAVAATAWLMGVRDARVRIVDQLELLEDLGRFGPSANALQVAQHAEMMIEGYTSYEDILYPLAGLFGTPSPSGAGPYVWTFSAPYASAPTPQKFTAEFGMTGGSYKVAGALFKTMSLRADAGGVESFSAELIGKVASTVTLAALSARTFEAVRAADTALYIDAWDGTVGTTAIATTGIGWELTLDTRRHLKTFMNSLTPGDFGEDRWEGTLRLTLEFNSTVKTLVETILAGTTQRQIELRSTSGSKVIKRQFAGTLDGNPVELFGDREGNSIVELTFRGTYNSTLGNWLKMIVTNGVASLT